VIQLAEYLLDSDVLIDWLKGKRPEVELLERLASERHALAVNAISVAETFAGFSADEVDQVYRLVKGFDYWVIELPVAILAGQYRNHYARRGRPLAVPDTLIAAQAVARDATVITRNVRDFPMPELKVLNPE
jgi:predicted nucleic acid-binding protein